MHMKEGKHVSCTAFKSCASFSASVLGWPKATRIEHMHEGMWHSSPCKGPLHLEKKKEKDSIAYSDLYVQIYFSNFEILSFEMFASIQLPFAVTNA